MPRDSRLPPGDVLRFYRIWEALLGWVNAQKHIAPGVKAPYPPRVALPIREACWADDGLRRAWIETNPDGMPAEDLALVRSWDHRVAGTFAVARHYAGHSVFLGKGETYAVLGLTDPLRDMLPVVPIYVEAVLLPYEGRITYDGLIGSFPISLGPGIRRTIADDLRRTQERDGVCHALGPSADAAFARGPRSIQKANRSVLTSYAAYLKAGRHSAAVRTRELAVAEWLAKVVGSDRSLALLCMEDFQSAITASQRLPVPRSEAFTSLKRLVVFLAQTERLSWEEAEDIHAWLRLRSRGR